MKAQHYCGVHEIQSSTLTAMPPDAVKTLLEGLFLTTLSQSQLILHLHFLKVEWIISVVGTTDPRRRAVVLKGQALSRSFLMAIVNKALDSGCFPVVLRVELQLTFAKEPIHE